MWSEGEKKVLSLNLAEIYQFIVNSVPLIDSHHLLELQNIYHPWNLPVHSRNADFYSLLKLSEFTMLC